MLPGHDYPLGHPQEEAVLDDSGPCRQHLGQVGHIGNPANFFKVTQSQVIVIIGDDWPAVLEPLLGMTAKAVKPADVRLGFKTDHFDRQRHLAA